MPGTSKAPMWPRIWTQAARVADSIADSELAIQYPNIVFTISPACTQTEIGSGGQCRTWGRPALSSLVTEAQQNAAISDYQKLASSRNATLEVRINFANRLLEVGKLEEALALLNGLNASADMLTGESPALCSSGQICGSHPTVRPWFGK